MNIPTDPSVSYIAIILFLIGLFLFISGLNIIKIEKVTVSKGFKTWGIGLILMIAGIFLGIPKIINNSNHDNTTELKHEPLSNKINASLEKIIFYRGDKGAGNNNTCPIDKILVREIYRVPNNHLESLTLVHFSPSGTRKISVTQITIDNLTDYNFCMNESDLFSYPIRSIFISNTNKQSREINFKINIKNNKIEEPEEWGKFFLISEAEKETKIRSSSQTSSKDSVVIYNGITEGDVLYTRYCSNDKSSAWINRFTTNRVDNDGIAWGIHEKSNIQDPNIKKLYYFHIKDDVNLLSICKGGGCYVKEEYALADVKRWLNTSCP